MIRSILKQNVQLHVIHQNQRVFLSSGGSEIGKFVRDVLTSKKLENVEQEISKLEKANIKTMELLRKLNMHDWELTGVSLGAARALQDALWELKQDEVKQKTANTMKLRRENSAKAESKQKRL